MANDTLAERVRWLVDVHHNGNARAAGRAAQIPVATFFRILDGSVEKPRADALEKLSRLYDVSTDWLLFGDGDLGVRNAMFGRGLCRLRKLVYGRP